MDQAVLEKLQCLDFSGKCVGLVGVGKLGSEIRSYAQANGAEKILLCDPPRNFQEADELSETFFVLWGNGMGGCELSNRDMETFVPIESLCICDIICIQVPLTKDGKYPTAGLITPQFLAKCRPNLILVNFSDPEILSIHNL